MTAVPPPIPAPAPIPLALAPDSLAPLRVESLVASIGLGPFVSRTLTTVHGHHHQRASEMHDEITRKIHRFLNRDEAAPAAPLPPFDFKQVEADLNAPIPPEHVLREVQAFGEDGDLALQANLVVQRIWTYVKTKIPTRVYMSIFGPEPGDPPKSDIARFRRLWVIACDPLSILDDLNEYNVSRDQVKACSEMYPLVYATFWPITQAQRVRRAGVEPNWKLSRHKENILRVLTKQEEDKLPLWRSLQAIFAEDAAAMQPQPPAAPSGGGSRDSLSNQSTPAQRLDAET
jgi:hypothetical protein